MDFSSPYNGYAPLADTMAAHLYRQTASFHTPGHKGRAAVLKSLESLSADLTELPDTGSLYDGGDAIEEAEILAARAFGADSTFFSAGGCTLCIQAMLAIGVPPGGRVLMARNAHRSAVHAAALLGLDVAWLWPEGEKDGGFQQPAVENVESSLSADKSIRAVYVTSPDYGGRLCDIPALAAASRRGIRCVNFCCIRDYLLMKVIAGSICRRWRNMRRTGKNLPCWGNFCRAAKIPEIFR